MDENIMELKVKTLTPLWTGGVGGKCDRLHETGIIGSLRWWYEAIVRGLGGYACDPTSEKKKERCSLDYKKFQNALNSGKSIQEALNKQICPVCQLFGCTGWSRKFRVDIENLSKEDIKKGKGVSDGIKSGVEFTILITKLSKIDTTEKWLLKKTLTIIEKYGAIGGRTPRKPQKMAIGDSYGIIQFVDYGPLRDWDKDSNKEEIKEKLSNNKSILNNKENNQDWFDFRYFWYVKDRYLNRIQINEILELEKKSSKIVVSKRGTEYNNLLNFLRGSKGKSSKKIFSFQDKYENKSFVFGYVRNQIEIKKIQNKIREELSEDIVLIEGAKIMEGL